MQPTIDTICDTVRNSLPADTEEFYFEHDHQYLTLVPRPILAQASVLLLLQNSATLSWGEGPDLFLQNGPFLNFR